jgi:ATP-dependent helicase/nuclease subunit A
VTGLLDPSILVFSGERFRQWVEKNYAGAQWHVEVVASGPRAAGGDWDGTIDLVLQLPSGGVVVIDHKSAPIRREHCAAKSGQYVGQINAYGEVLVRSEVQNRSPLIFFHFCQELIHYSGGAFPGALAEKFR